MQLPILTGKRTHDDFELYHAKDIKASKKIIGRGITRKVYQSTIFPDLVIKREDLNYGDRYFQNIMEFFLWEEVETTKWAKHFAPCHWISSDGRTLYMSKTEKLQKKPDSIPSFVDDTHFGNFGRLGKRIVCHDYGINMLMKKGRLNSKLKKHFFW